jgi:hypothetical protein
MSRIYFHSLSDTAEVRGSERAHMGILCADLTYAAFRPRGDASDPLFRVTDLKREKYDKIGGGLEFRRDFGFFLSQGGVFRLGERTADAFDVCLNTTLAIGNDAVRLMARLHGQCEIHAWVEGPNRAWLAGIIEDGRAAGIMRANQGWESVAALLRSRDDEPVVTSYSVTDGFPNAHVAGVEGDEEHDAWYDRPVADQWTQAMAALREHDNGLEMRPDRWTFPAYHFMDGDTAFSIYEHATSPAPSSSHMETGR